MLSVLAYAQSLKCVLPIVLTLGSAPCYMGIWSVWRIITALLPKDVYRRGDDFLWSFYQRCVLFSFHTYTGLKVVGYGNVNHLYKKENVIYLSNHQSLVDWVVTDMLAIQQCSLGQIRFIAKEGLKYFPLYGFSFRQHNCCFVKRGTGFDQRKLEKDILLLKQDSIPSWVVIFPEGTRFNPELPEVIERTQHFAKDTGFESFSQVLTPRVKALNVCMKQISDHVTAIYDVTIGYSNTQNKVTGERTPAPNMTDFIDGASKVLHIYFERVDINDVPREEKELKIWLHNQFMKKERLLSGFYSSDVENQGKFPGEGQVIPIHIHQTLPAFLFFSTLFITTLAFPKTRSLYWKFGLLSSVGGCVWMFLDLN